MTTTQANIEIAAGAIEAARSSIRAGVPADALLGLAERALAVPAGTRKTATQPYSIGPFGGPRFQQNRDAGGKGGYETCAICGKDMKPGSTTHFAVVIDGGGAWGDENSPVDGSHMGTWPIGNDCHQRYSTRTGR